jgi:DNA repair and recombination protein RAD52
VLPAPPVASHHFNGVRNGTNGATPTHNRPPANRPPPVVAPTGRPVNGSSNNNIPVQPQTPNSGFARSNSGANQALRQQEQAQQRPMQPPQPIINGRVLNQPSRNQPASAPASPAHLNKPSDDNDNSMPPQGTGFFSARAANMLPEIPATEAAAPPQLPNHLPAFNPHAESPSIRKTPGVDHKSSKPLTKDLKHVPGSTQAAAPAAGGLTPRNVVNPQLDGARKIGAPGMGGAGGFSPMGNRGGYKPPSMLKRPPPVVSGDGGNGRVPLTDLPPNESISGDAGGDIKRQRVGN